MAKPSTRDLRKYPGLAEEMGGQGTIGINSVRSALGEAEKAAAPIEHGYEPTAIDYIRRCSTGEQAVEIINYLEVRGEIDAEHAKRLRTQLAERGLKSFGKERLPGCYDRGEIG